MEVVRMTPWVIQVTFLPGRVGLIHKKNDLDAIQIFNEITWTRNLAFGWAEPRGFANRYTYTKEQHSWTLCLSLHLLWFILNCVIPYRLTLLQSGWCQESGFLRSTTTTSNTVYLLSFFTGSQTRWNWSQARLPFNFLCIIPLFFIKEWQTGEKNCWAQRIC